MAIPGREVRHYFSLVSRKAEEAALRRYQATHWLEYLVGPLGIESQPSEREFISCLRNGLVLCNLISKIEPGSVPKVVENQASANSPTWDSQPLPAYQYFENVRNFLAAIEQLKLPAFEASIFERENVEEGSAAKVVDCILALKAYHEWKQIPGSNGFHNYKPPRSPFVAHSSSRIINSQLPGTVTSGSCRQLDMTTNCDKRPLSSSENQQFQELIIKALAERMVDKKENMDNNLIASFRDGNMDAVKLLGKFVSTWLEQEVQKKFPELKSENLDKSRSSLPKHTSSTPLKTSAPRNSKCCRACLQKGYCKHWTLVEMQEKELLSLKALLSDTRKKFEDMQIQLSSDLKKLGSEVQEMSISAQKYQEVVRENWNLYNMVQDLKGSIRVYCRIRPLSAEGKTVIDFIGEDGSLVVVDPFKTQKDGRKSFQFSRLFGPNATQEDVFKETQPLIRSVMDGYNVCIFAYGQTGSGKTHTMYGPSSGSTTAEKGINYLALNDLFQLSNVRKDIVKYDMHVQMVEIYNEQVRDLLAEDSSVTKLETRGCSSDNDFLPNASMHHVMYITDVINLMKYGEMNRAVGPTASNDPSSRSHRVLTVHVHQEDVSGTTQQSCLHLVDLAGSESINKSGVTGGGGLIEAQHINKSLSCLGDVIMALAQKNSYIPYRNSKLTLLLRNALGGNAKTLMLVHVSPEDDSFGETVSTLKFSQRVSTVELGAASQNKEINEVLELKAELESLRAALANRETKTPLRNKPKELVPTQPDKPKAMIERTPPRTRRLSTENCSALKVGKMKVDERKGPKTPSTQAKSRRLSLEGPRYGNKTPEQIKLIDPVCKPVLQLQDDPVKTPNGGSTVELNCPRPPRSPTNNALKSLMEKTDIRTKNLQPQQQPKTPEPVVKSRNIDLKGTKSEHSIHSEFPTPGLASTQGKGASNIRKSLRSIGKLIHGSEKSSRSQQKLTEVVPVAPVNGSSSIQDAKSPISTNARALRRRSLTGVLPPESSRRSSLGGADVNRNSKTPPPTRASTKLTKRWI